MTPEELQVYKSQQVKQITTELFQMTGREESDHGIEFANDFIHSLVATMISTLLFSSLDKPMGFKGDLTKLGQAEKYALTRESYRLEKKRIETMVEQAFSRAMSVHNPRTIPEYSCQVQMVDDGSMVGTSN